MTPHNTATGANTRDTVDIRDAVDADLDDISRLATQTLDLDSEDASSIPSYVWDEEDGLSRVRRVAVADGRLAGALIGSVHTDRQAFVDLIMVTPTMWRRGIGNALLADWEATAHRLGGREFHAGANLMGYAWPGVDIRYTGAICLLLRHGYVRSDVVYNMDLPVTPDIGPNPAAIDRLHQAGVTLRRGRPDTDADTLPDHALQNWSPAWAREVTLALRKPVPTVFVALRGTRIIGFAAHSVYRPCLYGPIATDPAEQSHGIGDALSRLCLQDMARSGITTAQIGWIAETAIPFYATTVGARLGRCFWMLTKHHNASPRGGQDAGPGRAERFRESPT